MNDRNRTQAAVAAAQPLTRKQAIAESMPHLETAIPIGLVGAGAVAVFVLVLDLAAGQALATPNALGATIFRDMAFDLSTPISAINVFSYTMLHSALFIVAATAAITAEYTLTENGVPMSTQFMVGVVVLFGGLQVSILTLMLLVDAPLATTLGPARLLAINAIAATAMMTAVYAAGRARLARREQA